MERARELGKGMGRATLNATVPFLPLVTKIQFLPYILFYDLNNISFFYKVIANPNISNCRTRTRNKNEF